MPSRYLCLLPVFIALQASTLEAQTTPHGTMLRFPDVSENRIVFSYANDLWTVPREGGLAQPLASPPGTERMPRFSPDGSRIAFSGNYDGNMDLYVVPVEGGVPHRATYHPAGERMLDWTPDGDLMFQARNYQGNARVSRLFTTSAQGGLPQPLPVPYGSAGAISSDGQYLAYTPWTRDGSTWKRYRGGMATDLWLIHLPTGEAKQLTDWEGTDTQPMWHGNTLYYLSDAGPAHRKNIWTMNHENGESRQVTFFKEHDVQWPTVGPGPDGQGEIIMQAGTGLQLLDLETEQLTPVEIQIPGDRPTIRTRRVPVGDEISNIHISPSAQRLVLEAHGDIWSLPVEEGPARNLTRSSDQADRDPHWSPDGQWVAFFSDRSGEYELWIQQSDGQGEARQITTDGGVFKMALGWNPDGTRFAFGDMTGTVHLYSVDDESVTTVGQDPLAELPTITWSPDGRWLVYDRTQDETIHRALWAYDTESGKSHRLTSGMFNDTNPVFDRDGEFLYFTSNRSFRPTYSNVDDTFIYDDGGMLMMVPVRADIDSPWLVEINEEVWEEDEPAEEPIEIEFLAGNWEGGDDEFGVSLELRMSTEGTVEGIWTTEGDDPVEVQADLDEETREVHVRSIELEDDEPVLDVMFMLQDGFLTGMEEESEWMFEKAPESINIDAQGFETRSMPLPVPPGSYRQLAVTDNGQLMYIDNNEGAVFALDTHDREAEPSFITPADFFMLTPDGASMLISDGETLAVAPAMEGAEPAPVDTSRMVAVVDPRAEWEQIFDDTWRIFRDYFYLENMHGVDWKAVREHYRPMLADCTTREDLNYVIDEMIAELNVGHAYNFGSPYESGDFEPVGLLGVDFNSSDDGWRIERIHRGGDWDADARGPLGIPGLNVQENDVLLAVNGIPLDPDIDPHAAFVGTAGTPTVLTILSGPDQTTREVTVTPVGYDANLRYRSWVEDNRRAVEEATEGRVGYIHVPDTGVNGQNELFRQFFGQSGKDALIIDERFNGGGQIPWRFIELLNRPVTNHWAVRNGRDWKTPYAAHHGPKCMIINGLAGSGGDMFPWLFREAGIGPIIGERTWGGLVGISGNPRLIDGSGIAVPTFGFYETDGTWGVEGHGVDPDIEVVADPEIMMNGTDPQLQRAIDEMLAALAKNPPTTPTRPQSPDRRGMGLPEEDK